MLQFFREILSYRTDGLHLIFTRGMPLVWHECCDSADEQENRRCRRQIITEFMRKVRQYAGGIPISVLVPGTREANEKFGLDLNSWIGENLINILMADSSRQNAEHEEGPIEIEYFKMLTDGRCP